MDCSASMLLGRTGLRPLDLAIARIEKARQDVAEPGRDGRTATAYALAFDPRKGASRLLRLDRLLGDSTGDGAVTRLMGELPFYGVDYAILGRLRRQGYGKISLLADALAPGLDGVDLVRLGPPGGEAGFSAWPAAIRFDREKGNWSASFVQSLPPSSIVLSRWDAQRGFFDRADPTTYAIEPRDSGWAFRIASPGIYLATVAGPMGEGPLEFPFRLVEARRAGAASGAFSTAMMGVFPLIEPAPRPSLVFLDRGSGWRTGQEAGNDRAARGLAAKAPGALGLETWPGKAAESYLPPALTSGRPVLGAALPASRAGRRLVKDGWSFTLGPEALANTDLPLAYDGSMLRAEALPFALASGKSGIRGIMAAGRFLFTKDSGGLLPLVAPAAEFFPTPSGKRIAIAAPRNHAPLWAGLLGLAALAKLLTWRKLGRKTVRKDT